MQINLKYSKTPKNSDTQKNYCNYPKIWLILIFHRVMCLNDADGMANSVDPDQTAPLLKYSKTPKNSDTQKNYCNYPKIWLILIFHRVMCLNDADGMANSVDPDQTAPLLKYSKTPKNSDTQKNYCNYPKIWLILIFHRVMCLNYADRMANSVDPDQTAPLGAVWSGSTLFAQVSTQFAQELSVRKFMNITVNYDFVCVEA